MTVSNDNTPPTLEFDDTDILALASTLFGECRGEKIEGQRDVAWVIRNRATRARFVRPPGVVGSVFHVCRAPAQFSCWNTTDPNRAACLAFKLGDAAIASQENIARLVLAGAVPDLTNGADHYHTIARPPWADEWPPYWAASMLVTARIGGHVFYDSRRAPVVASA